MAAIDRAFEAGATSFLVKPINWRLLSYQIRYVMRAGRTEPAALDPDAAPLGDVLKLAREGADLVRKALAGPPELRQTAQLIAPIVQQHLDMARDLQQRMLARGR